MTTYLIHDNGDRSFKVVVENRRVKIYKSQTYRDTEFIYKSTPSYIFDVAGVFVGESPLNSMTDFSGGHGPAFSNSLLLQLSELRYVHIGRKIFSFQTCSKIISFVSPIGNNDVPYPYAIDREGNTYLFLEQVILGAKHNNLEEYDDSYDFYYSASLMTTDTSRIPPKTPINIMGITNFYIGEDEFIMRYQPFPKKNFNRYEEEISVMRNGKRQILTRKKYIKMMKKFGKQMRFRPLKHKTIM